MESTISGTNKLVLDKDLLITKGTRRFRNTFSR